MQQKILNNRYELERRIGEGGMARVYKARDLRLNRTVAVKVLHSHYASDAGFLQRFHHEAQAAANLHHPNIVDVYDVGQDGEIHYIVMEFVEGSDLKSLLLRQGSLSIEQAIMIAEQAALGLSAAHRLGMIHRDVKPQNIMVTADLAVKLTDFGIAKSAFSTAQTETGVTFGTADYISPEQARGQAATPQSDIYSLGVTLYEMLTGRIPFTGDSLVAVAMQHVSSEPPPLRMYNPQIPLNLEALVLTALAKEPAMRPASARDFAVMLRGYRSSSEQETIAGIVRPPMQRPPAQRPPAQRPPAQHAPLPVPPVMATRPPAPATTGAGREFGAFLLGMLMLSLILGGVYLFTTGTFNDLINLGLGRPASPRPIQTQPQLGDATTAPPDSPTAPGIPTTTPVLVVVPNIVGLDETIAINQLEQSGLRAQADLPRNDDFAAPGLIIDQFPSAGSLITETSTVTYAISLGPTTLEIPAGLAGLAAADAQFRLNQAGFAVQIVEQPSRQMSVGFVIRTDPAPPVRLPRGSTIRLVVSMGDVVQVPEVTGLPLDEARRRIEAAGLFISYADIQNCDKLGPDICARFAPGIVVSSEPRGGTWLPRGEGVTLGVRE